MPRPKGCTCGTPKPCKIHPPAEEAARDTPGGHSQESVRSVGDMPAEPILRVIEGERPKPDSKPRRRPDPKPKPKPPRERDKPVAPDKPDDTALTTMLAELLTLPAIPMAMLADCSYCRDHFIAEGPKAARELVALSIVNPALRGALEALYAGWSKITIFGVLAGYLAKPVMHHIAPEPVLAAAGPVLGVPPRPPKPKKFMDHQHEPTSQTPEHAGPETEDPGPPAEPFGEAPEDQPPGDPASGINAT